MILDMGQVSGLMKSEAATDKQLMQRLAVGGQECEEK